MIQEASILLEQIGSTVGTSPAQQKAWEMLGEIGLPGKKSEAYKFTSITSALEKKVDFGVQGNESVDTSIFYDEEGSHLVFVNGNFSEEQSIIASDLTYEIKEVSEGKHDPFSLLNTALASNELVITSGTEKPVFVYHFNTSGISNPRIKAVVKDNTSLRIIEKVEAAKDTATFTNLYVDFEVGRNAFGYHTQVQNYHENAYTHETVFAKVVRDGQFYNNTFSFEGAMVRNNLIINLEDEHCEGHMYGLFLLDKKSHVDNNTTVDHLKPNGYSNELYKGILDEKSTGVFNGKIYVRQDAQKTNAFQSNNNILLSEDATIHTKPQLEIWADDVKCSHGCTSGQLDEDAIFYLRARGINERNAKAMLLNAFATETMEHIKVESVREEVQSLIDRKLV